MFFSAAEVATAPAAPPATSPSSGPSQVAEAPPRSKQPGRRWLFVVVAIAAIVAVVAVLAHINAASRQDTGKQTTRSTIVEQRDFVHKVRVHGIVEAVESHTISAPRLSGQGLNTLIITRLVKSGSAVRQGDVLVEFDRQAQLKNVLDKEAEYKGLVAQISKKEAEQAAARAADET